MANLGNTKVNGSLQADEVKIIGEAGQNALFVSGNATIKGDLEVQGDLVYVGTKDIRVEDKTIEIAYKSGSATTSAEADGAGLIIGNEANPVASIRYRHSDQKIVFDKQIAATVDSASVAERAETADKTKAAVTFGAGFKNSGSSFDGSEAITVEVNPEDVKMKSAEHADSASKVDNTLTIKGDGVEETVFDGSEAKVVTIDLKDYQKVADFNEYTASAAQEHANILASASKYESASAAALNDYSASQATVNTNILASASAVSTSLNEYSASQSTVNDNLVASASKAESASVAAVTEYSASQATVNDNLVASASKAESASLAAVSDYSASQATVNSNLSASVATEASKSAAALNDYSASQATVNSDLSASVATAASASAAAINDYSASQANVNAGLAATASANSQSFAQTIQNVQNTYVTTASYNSYTQSVSQSINEIQEAIGESGSVAEQIATAIEDLTVASTGSAGFHIVSVAQNSGSISATVAKDDEYTIVKQDEAEEGFLATYQLTKNGVGVGAKINLAKDLVVESGDVKTVTEDDKPVAGYKVGDKYIDLVLANSEKHIYILVSDLVDKFDGKNIVLSADYVKAATYTEPAVGDTIDAAIGKLAKGVEVARSEASASASAVSTSLSNYSASQATVNTNILASASKFESASAAALNDYSASQAQVNNDLSASVATEHSASAAALTGYSASQATVNTNILASASKAESASAAALSTYSASQATVNTNILASASKAESASAAALNDYSASQATVNANVLASASNWHNADATASAAAQKKADEAYASASAWHTADSKVAADAYASASAWHTADSAAAANAYASASAWHTADSAAAANALASASAYHNEDSASAAAAQRKADEAYASASAWHNADSASAAQALASASALDSRLEEVEAATGSYMEADASNSNIGADGIKFADGAAVIKFNATEQAFEFIFN